MSAQLVVNSYLNMPYFEEVENSERMTEILESLGFVVLPPSNLEAVAGRIGSTMTAKSGGIGSPCGGVIDRGYLDVEQVLSNGIIITVESMEKHSSRASVRVSPYLRGFTVIKFKKQHDGQYYLYIDVICANDPQRIGIANALWRQVFLAAGNLRDAGLINGIQLSSLTYVVAYYFRKVGFKFYNIDNTGEQTLDDKTNAAALELSKWRFTDDDKNELLVVQQSDESWYDYAMRLSDYDDDVSSGFIDSRDRDKLRQLLDTLNELQKHPNRRESLTSRYSTASQITDLLNKINQKGDEYDENSSPTIRFMEIAAAEGHSADLGKGGFRAPASKRNAGGSEDYDDVLNRLDPGSQGWTMFLIGEDFSKLRAHYDSMMGGARRKKGRKSFKNQQAGKRHRRRKTRKRSAGMYSVSERNRLKNLEKNIPFSLLVKTKNMSPKQKLTAFKKIGIKKKDLQGMAQMRKEEMIGKNALTAHRQMMLQEVQKNKKHNTQAGGKRKKNRKRKTHKNQRRRKSKKNRRKRRTKKKR